MRTRNESLRTGTLLAYFDRENSRLNASLLFLVEGVADIAPMRDIERVCHGLVEGDDRFQWHTVANQLELTAVNPRLDSAGVTRFEVAELHGLTQEELRMLLEPAVAQLRNGERVRFPSATRAEGGVARGIDFLDREDELTALQRFLDEGRNILLVAPRRSGKTSLLHRLEELLASRFRTLRLDVSKYRNAEGFAAELLSRVSSMRFTEALKQVRRQGWREVLTESLQELANGGKPLVLMLDELAWHLEHLGADDGRALLEKLDEVLRKGGARLVVAGSLELGRMAREQLRIELPGLFGELQRFPLPPMARARLALNLRRVLLGTGLVLQRGDLEWMAENVDLAMPYPALRFISHLSSVSRVGPLTPSVMEQELSDYLASTDAFAELDEQLTQEAQKDPQAAEGLEAALDRLSSAVRPLAVPDVKAMLSADPAKQAESFNWLVEHFPLSVEGERVYLASRLFQRYWRARRGADT